MKRSKVAAGLGFEPRKADSESAVIPFHHPAIDRRIETHFIKSWIR